MKGRGREGRRWKGWLCREGGRERRREGEIVSMCGRDRYGERDKRGSGRQRERKKEREKERGRGRDSLVVEIDASSNFNIHVYVYIYMYIAYTIAKLLKCTSTLIMIKFVSGDIFHLSLMCAAGHSQGLQDNGCSAEGHSKEHPLLSLG